MPGFDPVLMQRRFAEFHSGRLTVKDVAPCSESSRCVVHVPTEPQRSYGGCDDLTFERST